MSITAAPPRFDKDSYAVNAGATAAEKSEGTSRGLDVDTPSLYLPRPFPVSRCCFAHISPIPSPTLLSDSP